MMTAARGRPLGDPRLDEMAASSFSSSALRCSCDQQQRQQILSNSVEWAAPVWKQLQGGQMGFDLKLADWCEQG